MCLSGSAEGPRSGPAGPIQAATDGADGRRLEVTSHVNATSRYVTFTCSERNVKLHASAQLQSKLFYDRT